MKVVIFCGGMGTRLKEMTEFIPKPMVMVGEKPILWHIMKIFYQYGLKQFILCLGFKGEAIKDYFMNYHWLAHDFTVNPKTRETLTHHENLEDWVITFADTGLETPTEERLAKVQKFLKGEDRFIVTYGDGLADIDLRKLLEFHEKSGKIATVTGTRAISRYGMIQAEPNSFLMTSFQQKPRLTDFINIGFMVFEGEVFKYLGNNRAIEDLIIDLVKKEEIVMYPHEGFFYSMDTYRDYLDLNKIWDSGNVPWKIWE